MRVTMFSIRFLNFLRIFYHHRFLIFLVLFVVLTCYWWIWTGSLSSPSSPGTSFNNVSDSEIRHDVLESAKSLASKISPDLFNLFQSLQHPKNNKKIGKDDLVKYYVESLLQLSANGNGSFYESNYSNNFKEYSNFKFYSSAEISCKSRHERFRFHRNSFPPPSPHFFAVLYRYAEFHKDCTEELLSTTMKDLSKRQLKDFNGSCRFIYVPSGTQGLGNKLMLLTSAIVYAILTQRVILIDPMPFSYLLCEPFPFSSWIFPFNTSEAAAANPLFNKTIHIQQHFHNLKYNPSAQQNPPIIVRVNNGLRFACDEAQHKLHDIPWVILDSCVYFLPELYPISSFANVLQQIFPDNVFTHISRWFLLPKDDTWQRIVHLKEAYLQHGDHVVGMHLRYLVYADKEHFANHWNHVPYMNMRIHDCIYNISHALPLPWNPSDASKDSAYKNTTHTKKIILFVASQFANNHADYFKNLYAMGGEKGEVIAVQSVSSPYKQLSEIHDMMQSFSEMWLLSFSDILFISSNSTFSYVAAGLGGHAPWALNYWPIANEYPSCTRRENSEPCHLKVVNATCSFFGPNITDLPLESRYPHFHTCPDRLEGVILSNINS